MPEPSYAKSAEALDRLRLGKQRLEVMQLLGVLAGAKKGWRNHPASLMWEGHASALAAYGVAVCDEWTSRGYKDTCKAQIEALHEGPVPAEEELAAAGLLPAWHGDEAFHRSHQAHLVRKDPDVYRGRYPDVPENLELLWPRA